MDSESTCLRYSGYSRVHPGYSAREQCQVDKGGNKGSPPILVSSGRTIPPTRSTNPRPRRSALMRLVPVQDDHKFGDKADEGIL